MRLFIDINCDLGEGKADDTAIMPLITSCNIACGGHAGDLASMEATVILAKEHRVKIGAHPSFPDQENFGRVPMEMAHSDLVDALVFQINQLLEITEENDVSLHHVKPHGALYNLCCVDSAFAKAVIEAIEEVDNQLTLYAPYESVIEKEARGRLHVAMECFTDRRYHADATLVSRKETDAVINQPKKAAQQAVSIVRRNEITTIDGPIIAAQCDTLCVHSDTENAVEILKAVRYAFKKQKIDLC